MSAAAGRVRPGPFCSEVVPSGLHSGLESVGAPESVRLQSGWGQRFPCWALSQAPPSVLPAAPRGRIFLRACLYTKNPRLRVVKTQAQRGTGFQPTLFRSAEHALRAHVHTSLRALRPAACSSGWGCSEWRAPAQCGPWGCREGRAPAQCGGRGRGGRLPSVGPGCGHSLWMDQSHGLKRVGFEGGAVPPSPGQVIAMSSSTPHWSSGPAGLACQVDRAAVSWGSTAVVRLHSSL